MNTLTLTDSLGSTKASVAEPILISGDVGRGLEFQHYLDEQMRDPEFRFWWYFHTPEFWLRSKLASLLFWLARMVHGGALWVIGVSLVDVEDET